MLAKEALCIYEQMLLWQLPNTVYYRLLIHVGQSSTGGYTVSVGLDQESG